MCLIAPCSATICTISAVVWDMWERVTEVNGPTDAVYFMCETAVKHVSGVTFCSCPFLSPRKAMVWPASVAVVTAVSCIVELTMGVALRGTALAMGLGVCSPPQGYSERETW